MLRSRLTFANVTSVIALFVALSAGSYAAMSLPKNSVGSKQIRKNAVTRTKVASNAINSAKVADGSLSGADLNLTTLGKVPAAALADVAGSVSGIKTVTATGQSRDGSNSTLALPIDRATANCGVGFAAIGGGASLTRTDNQLTSDSFPSGLSTWTADVVNAGPAAPFTVYAVCMPSR